MFETLIGVSIFSVMVRVVDDHAMSYCDHQGMSTRVCIHITCEYGIFVYR